MMSLKEEWVKAFSNPLFWLFLAIGGLAIWFAK